MKIKEIIISILVLIISYYLKGAFNKVLCDMNPFSCFIAFLMYTVPVIIIIIYWTIKLYPFIE